MPKVLSDKEKHRVERIVDALVLRAEADVERLWQAHLVHGRPAFWQALTKEERVARFQDENIRLSQLAAMVKDGDMTEAERHYTQMTKLAEGDNGESA